jgi:drug/metabolite transporter, DME family
MTPPTPREAAISRVISPSLVGVGCCVVAALGYSAVNVYLRDLTSRGDPAVILCVKELVAVVLVGPWLAWQAFRGRPALSWSKPLMALAAIGFVMHMAGNLPVLWAMTVVGLAITVPTALGVNLVSAAALGWVVLGERVSARSVAAIALLMVAILLLSTGAAAANESMAASIAGTQHGTLWAGLAVGFCCFAGVTYSALGIGVRHAARGGVSIAAIAFIVPAMGALGLAPLCLWRHGAESLTAIPWADWERMLVAGVINLVAFFGAIKGLQLTSVVFANVIGASQVALAALTGFLFFAEPAGPGLAAGLCLTVWGMLAIGAPKTS